jgi:AmmeMemoRadiSam system protein B/AmmeMemoRadiSam system protein A
MNGKNFIFLITAVVISVFIIPSYCYSAGNTRTRKSAVAGRFYGSDPVVLKKSIKKYTDVKLPGKVKDRKIAGIIVPHAGYIYSGPTAGYAFKAVEGKKYSTVILIGSSHYRYIGRPASADYKKWVTPLGEVATDLKLLAELKKNGVIEINNAVHDPEHCLEVELPFLQTVLADDFKILPLLLNDYDVNRLKKTADKIARLLKGRNEILIVISTDLSHYHSSAEAQMMDKKILDAVEENNLYEVQRLLDTKKGEMCGSGAVILGLLVMKETGAGEVVRLDYSHSGMITGDNAKVVGYGAFAVCKSQKTEELKMGLTENQKIKLLKLARNSMETFIRTGKKIEAVPDEEVFKEKRGAFVTLHMDGRLRGCIGNIIPVEKLYQTVIDMSIESSTGDPRFRPVTEDELDNIEIEISVLTVPEKVENYEDIVIGRDGVIVKQGFRQGVYLPQVADETGWNRDQFLSSLCASKAGIQPDAWKDGSAELYVFQAEVFSEKEMGLK